jgi:Fe-S oxidoreductase
MSDLIENTRLCSVCFKMCRDACSVAAATRHEADSPHNRGFFAYRIMQGKADLNKETVEYFYRCSMCKACREACETGLDTSESMLSARNGLDDSLLPATVLARKGDIVTGKIHPADSDEVSSILKPYISKAGAHTLVYFGRRLRALGADTVRSTVNIFKKLSVEFSVLPEEPDTAQLAYFLGFSREAAELAKKFKDAVEACTPKTLVVMSADDLRMIKLEFPKLGLDIKNIDILSLPEFLLASLKQKKPELSRLRAGRVTYHDPCGLGRELRQFEAPREIIGMVPGIKLVEMAFSRDQAPCCGYGSGLEISHPEIMREMASRLVSIAVDANADILVTGCPTCRSILLENIKDCGKSGHSPEILDIPAFLEKALQ